MGKIFVIMGRSSSGKDTILQGVLSINNKVKSLVQYTTRPIRPGEVDGKDYYFVSDSIALSSKEKSVYFEGFKVSNGVWYYYYNPVKLGSKDYYVCIATPETYKKFVRYYGGENIVPIEIVADERTCLLRSIDRELLSSNPNYKEVCRRFLSDSIDYEDLCCPNRFFNNGDRKDCIDSVNKLLYKYII